MEISDNDANVTTPSKGLNDHVYTLQGWVPKCDQQLKPVVGNVFDTLEEGNNFYTTYALEVGFNICRSIEVKYKDGEIKFKYYVCSRQGFKEENRRTISVMLVDEKRMPKTRRRKETREEFFRFYEGHKHALATPTKKQFLKSARNVNNVHKNLLLCFDKANVVPSKACQIMNSKVFTSVSPKFCIWHILKKLSEKLSASLNANTDFHSHFKSCVSNLESSKEFELTWKAIICDFNMWISTYFKDTFLVGILRTTSRSESENSLFGNYLNKNLSLVEFWMRFNSAIESQRHTELLVDNVTLNTMPELKLHSDIEKHGREVYTHENLTFFKMSYGMHVRIVGLKKQKRTIGQLLIFILDHIMVNGSKVRKMKEVAYNSSNHITHCSHKKFESEGIPFGNVLNACSKLESESKLIFDAWAQLFKCMHMAGTCKEKLLLVINEASNIKLKLTKMKGDVRSSKLHDLESFIGSNVPMEIAILPPQTSNTKGCGKQIKGGKEKAMEQQQKRRRRCKACKQYAYHDSRNCPTKPSS
ncbi:hypothetical protein JHK87_010455 [Glycine soja]|nr:hypothetical protein JHK87_010455 [Glycine soja]